MSLPLITSNKKFKPGNIIPYDWYNRFLTDDGKTDAIAIINLADIVAWYRNGTDDYYGEHTPKFDGQSLLVSYDYFEVKFGFKEDRVRRSFIRLEEQGIVTRAVQNIELFDGTRVNRVLITLDKEFYESCFVDTELDIRAGNDDEFCKDLHDCNHPISNKTNIEENRSKESNFCKNSFAEEKQLPITGESRASYGLASFYPLGQSDINNLRELSGRQFSSNAINEILLSLSKKLPDHVFPNKKAFISYMAKALAYEMRDAVKISNESFRIKNNITLEERLIKDQEAFLNEIENSRDSTHTMQLSRKLAAVLDPSSAYNLLLAASFPLNIGSSELSELPEGTIFKIRLQRKVELSDMQYRLVLAQVQAVYGSHIDSIEFEITKQDPHLESASFTKASSPIASRAVLVGVWGNIRRSLIKTNGEAIDRNWFSKLIPLVDETARELKLKAPTSFIRDWVESHYQHLIESVCMRENYRLSGVTI